MPELLPTRLPVEQMDLVHNDGADPSQRLWTAELEGVECLRRY